MLNFRNTSLFFFLLAIVIGVGGLAWYWFLLCFLLYTICLFLGSYRVDSQFYMPVVCSGKTDKKRIALSFDDGPMDRYTPDILDLLKEKNVPAAFFCIGRRIEGREVLLQRTVAEGHLIGNHSFGHQALFDLFGAGRMQADLEQMNSTVFKVLGIRPRLFRPPYGVTNPNLARAVKATGMLAVGWSIRSLDTVAKNEAELFDRLARSLHPGAIILLHDTVQLTRQVLPAFIDRARESGYEFVRLDVLLNESPYA